MSVPNAPKAKPQEIVPRQREVCAKFMLFSKPLQPPVCRAKFMRRGEGAESVQLQNGSRAAGQRARTSFCMMLLLHGFLGLLVPRSGCAWLSQQRRLKHAAMPSPPRFRVLGRAAISDVSRAGRERIAPSARCG
jgi:hypothetical protein